MKSRIYILLCCSLSISSCRTTEMVMDQSYTYLALGDSYTIGQGVEASSRWPNQLVQELVDQDIVVDSLYIIARTGWTTGDLLRAMDQEDPGPYDLVSLLIGVNNQFQGRSFSEFGMEFNQLLTRAQDIAGTEERVFVVSIPDYGVTPFGASNREKIAEEIDAYNDFIQTECERRGVPFINVTEISRELGDGSMALAPDRLHPSGYQYKMWVEEIFPVVQKLISP